MYLIKYLRGVIEPKVRGKSVARSSDDRPPGKFYRVNKFLYRQT